MANTQTSVARSPQIFGLLSIHNMLAMVPYLACAAVLPDVMADLSMPAGMSAFTLTIISIIAGICMFITGNICDTIGYITTYELAIALIAVGAAVSAIAPGAAVFMIGRGIFAVGFGINCSCVGTIASMWYKGDKFAKFNTVMMILTSVGSAAAYIVIFPLISIFGSWRGAYMFFAVIIAIYFVCNVIFMKYPTGMKEGLAAQKAAIKAGKIPKPELALGRAFKRRNFLLLAVLTLCLNTSSALYQTYLPTYLTTEAGMSTAAASMINSAGIFAGMFGSLIGGMLLVRTERRKLWQLVSAVIFIAAGFVSLWINLFGIVLVCYILFNAGYYLRQPATSQYLIEEITPYKPAIIPAAVAITTGLPMLLSLVTSLIAGAMIAGGMSYGVTMQVFNGVCVIGLICCFFMTEVGPRAAGKMGEKQRDAAAPPDDSIGGAKAPEA